MFLVIKFSLVGTKNIVEASLFILGGHDYSKSCATNPWLFVSYLNACFWVRSDETKAKILFDV